MQCITEFAEERKMQVELISLPLLDDAVANYYTIACVEASSTWQDTFLVHHSIPSRNHWGMSCKGGVDLGKEIMSREGSNGKMR